MKSSTNPWYTVLVAALVVLLFGCAPKLPLGNSKPAQDTPAPAANGVKTQKPPAPDGKSLTLADPAVGLVGQNSYHVLFQQDVMGKIDGKPFERHTRLELTRSAGQVDFLQQVKSSEGLDAYFRVIGLNQATYRWQSQGQPCQGEDGEPEAGEIVEPANLLLPLREAIQVGPDTIHEIQAVHYRFDQTALLVDGQDREAKGEVWLAKDGGFVVKYTLNVPAKAGPTDEALAQIWTYELSPVGESEAIILPPTCIEVPVDLPVMSDAKSVTRMSGWMNYSTSLTALQTANFYLQKLPEMGWITVQKVLKQEPKLPFAAVFTHENRHLSLNIEPGEPSGLEVTLFLSGTDAPLAAISDSQQEAPPEELVPAADLSSSGLDADIPLYPGATGLLKMQGSVMYNAQDAPEVIAKFYKEQMVSNGWILQSEPVIPATSIQIWHKSNRTVTMTAGLSDGKTYVVVTSATEP